MARVGPLGQAGSGTRLDWGVGGLADAAIGARAVVVIDVLSFSTAVAVACSRGARVYPWDSHDEGADAAAARLGARLAVERSELSARSPFSLSPVSLRGLGPGDTLVLPSPNGGALCQSAAQLRVPVFAGCLRNRRALAHAVSELDPLAVIAAGERRPDGSLRPALEDLLGAGALIDLVAGTLSPEAEAAVAAWRAAAADASRVLRECASGRELLRRGFDDDVAMAAQVDADACVPRLVDGAFVDVAHQPGEVIDRGPRSRSSARDAP